MDQERDTNERTSSPGSRVLPGSQSSTRDQISRPRTEPPRSVRRPRRIHDEVAEIRVTADSTVSEPEPALDATQLPTLFELPDLSLGFASEERQHQLHQAHSGPPASHMDPPSGNHVLREQPKPEPPSSSDTTLGLGNSPAKEDGPDLPSEPDPAAPSNLAAKRDGEDPWGHRSAVLVSLLVMVSIAFAAGHAIHRFGFSSTPVAEESDGLDEIAIINALDNLDEPPLIARSEVPTDVPETVAPATSPTIGPPTHGGTAQEILAEVAELESQQAIDFEAALKQETAAASAVANSEMQANPADAVIALRSDEDASPKYDGLPAGSESQPDNDNYQRSSTPHGIDGFLKNYGATEPSGLPQDGRQGNE